MHEFSAACSIVDAAVSAAEQHNVIKVTVVNVEIGEFTFLIPEQLEFNFEIASKNTIVEGAELKVAVTKGRVKCQKCEFEGETEFDSEMPSQLAMFSPMQCPECKSSDTVITGGKDFVITNIEAEIPSS